MQFYKVKTEHDNKRRPDGDIYIGGELYTENEVIRYTLNMKYLEIVNIPQSKTYWWFGARFGI